MNRETSLYLDAVRFLAALAVFLSHLSFGHVSAGFLWQARPYADVAVTIFFVLSGFVIAYAAETRETSAGSYTVNRLARIYSVALPALIATYGLDALGRSLRPDLYTADWGYAGDHVLARFLAGITFTNEVWGLHVRQGSNGPYWSLGYEVWYYVVYGLFLYAPRPWRWPLAAGGLIVAGPAIALMFPVWLLGVATYHVTKRGRMPPLAGIALFAAAILLWVGYEWVAWTSGRWLIGWDPWFRRPQLPQDWVVALCFAASLIGFHAASETLGRPLLILARPIRWAAGATFTLYLFHMPTVQFLSVLLPWPVGSLASRMVLLFGTLALLFAVAALTERRKDRWRAAILALAGHWRGASAATSN